MKAGEESVAQVSGVREQAILTQAIRSELKTRHARTSGGNVAHARLAGQPGGRYSRDMPGW
ncbi:hypothetical protein ACLBOM_35040 [Escherichia coli]